MPCSAPGSSASSRTFPGSRCSTPTPTSGRTIRTASSRHRRSCSKCSPRRCARARVPDARARRLLRAQRCGDGGGRRARRPAARAVPRRSRRIRAPSTEARRCLDAGAGGIKLHPRAEQFTLSEPSVRELVAAAHEQKATVLIHAGRGIPALGQDTVRLSGEFPDARLILAHCAISDLAWLWRELPDHPNLFIDTSWWAPADVLAMFALCPPGNIAVGERLALRRADHRRHADDAAGAPGGVDADADAGRDGRAGAARARPRGPARSRPAARALRRRRSTRCSSASSRI